MVSFPRVKFFASLLALSSFLTAFFLNPLAGSSHEPITTNVRFNKEVIRILERNCLECHAAGRIKADIPLTTYEEARPWAKAIKEEVLEKRMPPYQAVRGFGSFQRDYGLSQRETDLIVSWVEGGAPKGEVKDLPQRPDATSAWTLGQPDLTLRPANETQIGPEENATRCLVLPTNLKEERWMDGLEFRPGNAALVHSASISITTAAISSCSAQNGALREELVGSWVPGQTATRFPKGVARQIPAGARLTLRIRYRGNGEKASDRSSIGIFFARETPTKQLTAVTITAPSISLPAEGGSIRVNSSYQVSGSTQAIGLRPLLFPFAKSIEATAYRPDGSVEVLVWAKDRRFDWEPAYFFKKPVALPEGTRIEVVAYLDNSTGNPNNPHDPPKSVRFAGPLCEIFLAQSGLAKVAATHFGF